MKICDGIYIGNQSSLGDEDSLYSNYVTHLVKISEEDPFAEQTVRDNISGSFQYVHNHVWSPTKKTTQKQNIDDLVYFIGHAAEEG